MKRNKNFLILVVTLIVASSLNLLRASDILDTLKIDVKASELTGTMDVPSGCAVYLGYTTSSSELDHPLLASAISPSFPTQGCPLTFKFDVTADGGAFTTNGKFQFQSPGNKVRLEGGATSGEVSKTFNAMNPGSSPITQIVVTKRDVTTDPEPRRKIATWIVSYQDGHQEKISLVLFVSTNTKVIQKELRGSDARNPVAFTTLEGKIFTPAIQRTTEPKQ